MVYYFCIPSYSHESRNERKGLQLFIILWSLSRTLQSTFSVKHSRSPDKETPECQRPPVLTWQKHSQRCLSFSVSMQRLANTKAHTSRFISANLPCNKFKNRLVNIMPYESTRVCLQPIRGVEGSDYINASFIDGYRWVITRIWLPYPFKNGLAFLKNSYIFEIFLFWSIIAMMVVF